MKTQHLHSVSPQNWHTQSFLPPTTKPQISNHSFTNESIHNVYLLPSRILKEAKVIIFHPRHFTYAIQFVSAGLTDLDKCPLCKLEKPVIASRALADHMLSVHDILGPFYSLVADNFWQTSSAFIKK